MSITDKIIQTIRSDLSDIASDHDKFEEELYCFLRVESSRAYNFVLDCLYLFEDTQLAKSSFQRTDLCDQDFGTLYLLYYGLFNACYMQQQAVLTICRELGVDSNLQPVKEARIISFRNSFSAHSPNRGKGTSEHSFILDRHALRVGSVAGYSANHSSGFLSQQAEISELLSEWDKALENIFLAIGERIYGDLLQKKDITALWS